MTEDKKTKTANDLMFEARRHDQDAHSKSEHKRLEAQKVPRWPHWVAEIRCYNTPVFPPPKIETEAEYDLLLRVADLLMAGAGGRFTVEADLLMRLVELIEAYEDEHYPFDGQIAASKK